MKPMKRFALLALLFIASALPAATITNAFTATGNGTPVYFTQNNPPQTGNYSITGVFVATLNWQFSADGVNYNTLQAYAATQSATNFGQYGWYRWQCSAFTSGTATCNIVQNPKIFQQQYNSAGQLIFQLDDAGVTNGGVVTTGGAISVTDATNSTTSLTGAIVQNSGSAATSVGIGQGNINAGGTLITGGQVTVNYSGAALVVGNGAGAPALYIDGAAGQARDLFFRTAGSSRWVIETNNTAEGGSNAGSDFRLLARSDTGTAIDSPIAIARAVNGGITFSRSVNMGTIGSTFVGNVIAGVQTGAVATVGSVGEALSNTVSTYTNFTTTATYQQLATVSLTPGDWEVTGFVTFSANASTITATSNAIFTISTTTASATGTTEGLGDIGYISQVTNPTSGRQSIVLHKTMNISTTTPTFLNGQSTFTVSNPQYVGSIFARRMR